MGDTAAGSQPYSTSRPRDPGTRRRAQALQRRSEAALARAAETMEASRHRMEQARSHVESSQARLNRVQGSDPESLTLTPIWTADHTHTTAETAGLLYENPLGITQRRRPALDADHGQENAVKSEKWFS